VSASTAQTLAAGASIFDSVSNSLIGNPDVTVTSVLR
jgi:hypothetical protein